jgi:hypothetical protein
MLYTSAGTALTEGLALAAYRAVEDNQAGIISVSYGECEMELGQAGNAFWSALWQQAAAQGQSVFVSAGDGGSAGCDNFDAQQIAYGGLQVNGIASTPYNVAVGGTDFYYSQYAGSPSAINTQLAAYWSSSTTAPSVSLKQPIAEQAWNNFFGYNLPDGGNPANQPAQTIVAGSGGASSAALYPSGSAPQGYPKPAWQTGTGVPSDKVRDIPDISLFAANGYNYSFLSHLRLSRRLLQPHQQRGGRRHRRRRHLGQHPGHGRHPGTRQPEQGQPPGAGKLHLLPARRQAIDCLSRRRRGRQPGALLPEHRQLRPRFRGRQLQRLFSSRTAMPPAPATIWPPGSARWTWPTSSTTGVRSRSRPPQRRSA